jgi:hypothetical protein
MVTLEVIKVALPVFESVTDCAVLVVPAFCWPKMRLGGDRIASGAVAGGGLPPLAPPPPPPQATQIPTTSNAVISNQPAGRRREPPRLITVVRASRPAKSQGNREVRRMATGLLKNVADAVTPPQSEDKERDLALATRDLRDFSPPVALRNERLDGLFCTLPGGTLCCGARDAALTGPVVLAVTVAVTAEEPLMVTDAGETLQLTSIVPVRQDRFIVPWNPFRGITVIVEFPDCPAVEILIVDGFADML